MLRGLGAVLILLGSGGLGFSMAGELLLRIRELEELQRLMLQLKSEIRYRRLPLADAFRELSEHGDEPFRSFFRELSRELAGRKGSSAGELWEAKTAQLLRRLHLSREEGAELGRLGRLLGCLDLELQMGVLDYYLQSLELARQQAEKKAGTHLRLYRYLGILGGAALVILVF